MISVVYLAGPARSQLITKDDWLLALGLSQQRSVNATLKDQILLLEIMLKF